MKTWALLGITFLFSVIAPLLAACILSICKLIYQTPDHEPAADAAPTLAAVSNADIALTIATASIAVSNPDVASTFAAMTIAEKNRDTGNHLRNGGNLNNLNEVVVKLNEEQSREVVVDIDDEEYGVRRL